MWWNRYHSTLVEDSQVASSKMRGRREDYGQKKTRSALADRAPVRCGPAGGMT